MGKTTHGSHTHTYTIITFPLWEVKYECVCVWSSVTNPSCGQLDTGNEFSPCLSAPGSLVSRDRFGCPVPRQPPHPPHLDCICCLVTAYSHPARFPRRCPSTPSIAIIDRIIPEIITVDPTLPCRWRSPPRVHRHRATMSQRWLE